MKTKDYPDLCEGFERGELPKNQRVRHIKWGGEFKDWPIDRQLKHAKDMASSINDALDKMQTERNELLLVCARQEQQIKRLLAERDQARAMLQTEMQKSNETAHQRVAEIQELRAELRRSRGG